MSDNDPSDEAIAPSSTDLQLPSAIHHDVPAGSPPDLGLPTRSIVQEPRWPHPNFAWSLLWCLLFLFVTQVPGAIAVGVMIAILVIFFPNQFPTETLNTPAALLQSKPMNVALGVAFFITELLVIGFSWLIIRLVVGRDWTRQLALRRPGLWHTLLALASFPALVLLANIAYEVLRKILHVPSLADYGLSGMEEMVEVFSKWPWSFAVLVIGLGPGIGEELWCRGFLGRGLVGNYGVLFGVLASSFFFGFIHIDPAQGAMAMVMGLWLHFVYLTTRSLLLPMLLHMLNNSFAVLITRVPQLSDIEVNPSGIPILIYASSLLLLIGVAYALYQSRARLAASSSEQLLVWRPPFAGVEYPPENSGMRVVHPLPSQLAIALVSGGVGLFVWACLTWLQG